MISPKELRLIQAAMQGDREGVETTLNSGIDANITDQKNTTALMYASAGGHLAIAEILIQFGANINQVQTPNGITALMFATAANQLTVVQFLIKSGANLNQINQDGTPALMIAAYRGYADMVKLLWENGADINLIDKDGDTALNLVIKTNNLEITRFLLEKGADPYLGIGALTVAIREGYEEMVKFLIDWGIDLNKPNFQGYTPIIEAITHKNLSITRQLIQAGAELKIVDDEGNNGLTYAIEGGDINLVQLLQQKGLEMPDNALILAAGEGHLEMVATLLGMGVEVNKPDRDGETALHLATVEDHREIVQILLKAGANADQRNYMGDTSLMIAALQGYEHIVQDLLQAGADPNLKNGHESPLTLAITQNYLNIVRLLLEAKADPDIPFQDGKTGLMKGADWGNLALMQCLIIAGADVNAKDVSQATPLMWASHRGYIEAVQLLLNTQQVQLDERNKGGYTALMLAKFNNYPEVVDLLEQAGAKDE